MAVLTADQLAELRRGVAEGQSPSWDKTQINAALQAIEDWFEDPAVKADVSGRINTATTPFVFTGAQKKRLAKFWLRQKFGRE